MKKVIFIVFLMTSSFAYSSSCESVVQIGKFARFRLRLNAFYALKDEDGRTRAAAVRELAKLEKPSLLKKALKNDNPMVRSTAIHLLGEMGESALPLLEKALKDGHLYVRGDVVKALEKIGLPALPLLEKALEDPDKLIQLNAVKVLIKMGKPAVPVLERAALKNSSSDVRVIAAHGLDEIMSEGSRQY